MPNLNILQEQSTKQLDHLNCNVSMQEEQKHISETDLLCEGVTSGVEIYDESNLKIHLEEFDFNIFESENFEIIEDYNNLNEKTNIDTDHETKNFDHNNLILNNNISERYPKENINLQVDLTDNIFQNPSKQTLDKDTHLNFSVDDFSRNINIRNIDIEDYSINTLFPELECNYFSNNDFNDQNIILRKDLNRSETKKEDCSKINNFQNKSYLNRKRKIGSISSEKKTPNKILVSNKRKNKTENSLNISSNSKHYKNMSTITKNSFIFDKNNITMQFNFNLEENERFTYKIDTKEHHICDIQKIIVDGKHWNSYLFSIRSEVIRNQKIFLMQEGIFENPKYTIYRVLMSDLFSNISEKVLVEKYSIAITQFYHYLETFTRIFSCFNISKSFISVKNIYIEKFLNETNDYESATKKAISQIKFEIYNLIVGIEFRGIRAFVPEVVSLINNINKLTFKSIDNAIVSIIVLYQMLEFETSIPKFFSHIIESEISIHCHMSFLIVSNCLRSMFSIFILYAEIEKKYYKNICLLIDIYFIIFIESKTRKTYARPLFIDNFTMSNILFSLKVEFKEIDFIIGNNFKKICNLSYIRRFYNNEFLTIILNDETQIDEILKNQLNLLVNKLEIDSKQNRAKSKKIREYLEVVKIDATIDILSLTHNLINTLCYDNLIAFKKSKIRLAHAVKKYVYDSKRLSKLPTKNLKKN